VVKHCLELQAGGVLALSLAPVQVRVAIVEEALQFTVNMYIKLGIQGLLR
jgi:hypothetical protein